MATMTIEQAQAYLRENTYGKLRAVIKDPYYGQRNATICNGKSSVMVLSPKRRTRGYSLDWRWVLKVFTPSEPKNMTAKFTDKAKKATFTNAFIRKCLAADPTKSPYENSLSTGVSIEGKIISLKSFGRQYPEIERRFRNALKERRTYESYRVPFRGYEATLSLWWTDEAKTELGGGLSLEYKDCGNGYYYLLINDDEFIGYDID
jgi:hypothetical protein